MTVHTFSAAEERAYWRWVEDESEWESMRALDELPREPDSEYYRLMQQPQSDDNETSAQDEEED